MPRAVRPVRLGLALVAALMPVLSGCTPHAVAPGVYRVWANGFLFHMIGARAVEVRDVCPSGEATLIRTRKSFSTVTLSVVSLGLYTPREVELHCRKEPTLSP